MDSASECPILCGYSQCWSPLWIQPVLVLLAAPATSYGALCGSSQCNSCSASSQRWSPLWIQPVLVSLVDRASECPLSRSSQCSFLSASSRCWSPHCMQPVLVPSLYAASVGPLIVCSQCWSPHSVYAASAGPLVDSASDCPLRGSSQCSLMLEHFQNISLHETAHFVL